jgi:hypothetical protein
VELLRKMEPEPDQLTASEEILEVVQDAEIMGLKLESGEGARILGRMLQRHLLDLEAKFQTEKAMRVKQFLDLVNRIPITLEVTEAQSFMFSLMKERCVAAPLTPRPRPWPATWWLISSVLQPGAVFEAAGVAFGKGGPQPRYQTEVWG